MGPIKAVIFDMDGVLVDSEYCIRVACIQMLAEHEAQADHEDFIPLTGTGEKQFIGSVVKKYGLEYLPEMKDRVYDLYESLAGEHVAVARGVPGLIHSLKAAGYRLAVASAADAVKVRVNLRCLGLEIGDFDAVITGSDVTRNKPDPEIFRKAAQTMKMEPERCLVVEDALQGCRAAIAAGMRCVGVTSTFQARELLEAGAVEAVSEVRELSSVLRLPCQPDVW